jgi:hypothetical protein
VKVEEGDMCAEDRKVLESNIVDRAKQILFLLLYVIAWCDKEDIGILGSLLLCKYDQKPQE